MMKRLEISSAYLSRSRVENLYSLQSETCGMIMVERNQNKVLSQCLLRDIVH